MVPDRQLPETVLRPVFQAGPKRNFRGLLWPKTCAGLTGSARLRGLL